jgi:2-C-methyl-D-erythritol 2,4-cyclodiphosphate synthase
LGAAGLGDIGHHFPPDDPTWSDIDSRVLLRKTVAQLGEQRLTVANTDITIVAQSPKLAPFVDAMCACISSDLQIETDRVNVKATTTEHLGFTGREEGIAAFAVVLLTE